MEKRWPPERVNSLVTPCAFRRFATSRPPCSPVFCSVAMRRRRYPIRYTTGVDDRRTRRRLRWHLSVRVALPPGRQDQPPLRGRGTARGAAAPVPPRQPHLELPLAATDLRSDRRGPPLRGLRPHGLRPLREAAAPVRLHARAPRRERPGPDRRARPARHHARGPRLGRADRPRRDARAARAPERDRPHEHLGLGAALVAAALHTRVPHRGTRREDRKST